MGKRIGWFEREGGKSRLRLEAQGWQWKKKKERLIGCTGDGASTAKSGSATTGGPKKKKEASSSPVRDNPRSGKRPEGTRGGKRPSNRLKKKKSLAIGRGARAVKSNGMVALLKGYAKRLASTGGSIAITWGRPLVGSNQ